MDAYERWYGSRIVRFLINKFVYERANAFFYTRPDGSMVRHRDVHIWKEEDIKFLTLDFHKEKKFHFYTTTEKYDWPNIQPHPTRFVKHNEWRKTVFKPAQEEQAGFVWGKDAVFELDCGGGHKRVAHDWVLGHGVAVAIRDALKVLSIREAWAVFSGSGGFHIWVPWTELRKYYEEAHGPRPEFLALAEFTKQWVLDVVLTLPGAKIGENNTPFIQSVSVDVSPNTRRGLIRCPYSIHPKTNNVAWPMTREEFLGFRVADVRSKFSIDNIMRIRLKDRGMPNIMR